jgi:hypothetical protein
MRSRSGVLVLAAMTAVATGLGAQARKARRLPYVAMAGTAGAAGMTDGGAARGMLGGYGYAAYSRLIVGAQGGSTTSAAPDIVYGMATLGWPARAIRSSLAYPFVGAGYGVLHGIVGPRRSSAVYGAGVGVDQVIDPDGFGLLLGFRGGYLYRSGDQGERAIYCNFALGLGGKRVPEEKPPVIVAQRHRSGNQQ